MINKKDDIAIIGIACRVPGASNYREFWNNLLEGKESISFFSDDDLRKANVPEHHISNKNYIKAKGILGNGEYFDPSFFNISPREASLLDPQYRFFLEQAVEALEDAGYYNDKEKDIGVFGGSGTPWHLLNIFKYDSIYNDNIVSIFTGNDKDYLTTRVSYQLNLKGPSLNIQTACSTSLVAVIQGVQSILNDQCKMALCGGISLETPEAKGYLYQEGSLNSRDGHCRAFDSRASGTVFSYGSGVVVLKKLSDAIRDRDNIYSIIRGVGLNNDGKSKVGFSAPSIKGQNTVELQAIESAGINPEKISFLEAHGTGTMMGDPIEYEAACRSFATYTDRKQFCPIVTCKPNIGHTDIAAGVVGLIKASLSLKYNVLPKMINYDKPNPQINLENSPFYINTINTTLTTEQNEPLLAMVNSFGVGGTNASVIIEEPLKSKMDILNPRFDKGNTKNELITLSAKSESALRNIATDLLSYLDNNKETCIEDICYTLSVGRATHPYKCSMAISTREELITFLNEISGEEKAQNKNINYELSKNKDLPIVFMFPGQGNQYINMGEGLYNQNQVFKDHIDHCSRILKTEYDLDILNIIFQPDTYNEEINPETSDVSSEIDQPINAQLGLFIIEYSLARLLLDHGVEPSVLIGHSIGEFTAGCISGIFSLEDVLSIIYHRATLVEKYVKKGAMIAINLSEEKFDEINDLGLDIAVINTPKVIVISGPEIKTQQLIDKLKRLKIGYKKLPISHAFHSKMVDIVVDKLYDTLTKVKINKPTIPILSTVNGEIINDITTPRYWAEHIRRTVNFSRAITNLHEEYESPILIEVGPGNSLASAVKQHNYQNSIGTLTNADVTYRDLISQIGKLWALGGNIDWKKYYKGSDRYRISLPTYPFERQKIVYSNLTRDIDHRERINEGWIYTHSWKRRGVSSPRCQVFRIINGY